MRFNHKGAKKEKKYEYRLTTEAQRKRRIVPDKQAITGNIT